MYVCYFIDQANHFGFIVRLYADSYDVNKDSYYTIGEQHWIIPGTIDPMKD